MKYQLLRRFNFTLTMNQDKLKLSPQIPLQNFYCVNEKVPCSRNLELHHYRRGNHIQNANNN